MENFLSGFFIFVIVLIIGLVYSTVKGLIWSDKDIINVTSSVNNGISFINENNVKFIPNRVIGTFWTDFYISKKGDYVYDFNENFAKETISYKILPESYVSEYLLLTKYTWWQSYGLLVILGIGVLFSFIGESFWKLIFNILSEA